MPGTGFEAIENISNQHLKIIFDSCINKESKKRNSKFKIARCISIFDLSPITQNLFGTKILKNPSKELIQEVYPVSTNYMQKLMGKFEHGKPDFPIFMEPKIILENYLLEKYKNNFKESIIKFDTFDELN